VKLDNPHAARAGSARNSKLEAGNLTTRSEFRLRISSFDESAGRLLREFTLSPFAPRRAVSSGRANGLGDLSRHAGEGKTAFPGKG
jgi:hypothetical protein